MLRGIKVVIKFLAVTKMNLMIYLYDHLLYLVHLDKMLVSSIVEDVVLKWEG